MGWSSFIYFAAGSIALWGGGVALLYLLKKALPGKVAIITGTLLFASFIVLLWIGQGYPPLRSMGETRLWYSLFLVLVGYIIYNHWGYRWIMAYSGLVASVFIIINLLKPELQGTNLMPALRSGWFVPHVTFYILSYALLGAATIASIVALVEMKREPSNAGERLLPLIDNLVYSGVALLMIGLLMGALWAKEAWGDYWSWDPKETWAFITAAGYLTYIHARIRRYNLKMLLYILPFAFLLLMITWIGVNYLPAARESVHVY